MSAGVEDRVHHVFVANGAFVAPRARAGWEGGGLWVAGEWRAWGCTCGGRKDGVVAGVEARVEVDVHGCVEVGLGVAAAKHRGGVGCTGWRAGH